MVLTSNQLLSLLTESNNQANQKLVNTMTYKGYTQPHAHKYIPLSHISIKVNLCFSINPIQDGLLRGCARMGGPKRPPSIKCVTYILQ